MRLTAGSSGSAEAPVPGKRWLVFGSLDYIYVPAVDVDGEALRYVQTLGVRAGLEGPRDGNHGGLPASR
jgi:hypothetical protein